MNLSERKGAIITESINYYDVCVYRYKGSYFIDCNINNSSRLCILPDRYIVMQKTFTSRYFVNVKQLTSYMRSKLKYFQPTHGRRYKFNANSACLYRITAPLGLIKLIINTEMDYHIGKQKCLAKKNFLANYLSDNYAALLLK